MKGIWFFYWYPQEWLHWKIFWYEEENFCEVSQYKNKLFVHTINFLWIFSTEILPPMVYTIPLPSIFLYWYISITYSAWFVIRSWKSIIVNFTPFQKKGIYILSSCFMHRSLTRIRLNRHPPSIHLISNMSKHMCLISFDVQYKLILNTVKLTIFKVLIFH